MDNQIETSPGSLAAGQIQFFDSIQPPLKSDEFTLTATQTITNVEVDADAPQYVTTQKLLIDGPRFVLPPTVIHSMFPPANQEGNYTNYLPSMVFKDFTLPWSRAINPESVTVLEDTPWMGLLTLHEAEFSSLSPTAKIDQPITVTAAQLLSPGAKILPPSLAGTIQDETAKVTVMDMDLAFFQSIAPTIDELPFLSHARMVNTDGKVILGMDQDGSFSLCVGNRTPEKGQKNMVAIVSFEGHQDHLHGQNIAGDYDKIRLVLLGSWQFTSTEFDQDFLNMMEALCKAGNGGAGMLQLELDSSTTQNALVTEAIEIGYVPLQNQMRVGEESTAWYRSPLVPAPTKRESNMTDGNYGPYLYSDHAMHYDPEVGIFNHAYSAAWQVGRLLALSDAPFARGLFQWRSDYLKEVEKQVRQKIPLQVAANIMGSSPEVGELSLHSAAREFFSSDAFRKLDMAKLTPRNEIMLGTHLPGMFSEKEKKEIIANGEDHLLAIANKINQ